MPQTQSLLEVRNLSVYRADDPQDHPLVSGVSFSLEQGKCLILFGESGSGKTILSRALTGLFAPRQAFVTTADIVFKARPLSGFSDTEWNLLRRRSIRYVYQDPAKTLNPLLTVRAHMALASDGAGQGDLGFADALARVGIADPAVVLRSFPHQLSVGMAQRVMIALALLPKPDLVIADEPTSAVDVDQRDLVVEILKRCRLQDNLAMIVATHDVEVARTLGDRVLVLLGGSVIEAGPTDAVFTSPFHPYTRDLLGAWQHIAGVRAVTPAPHPPGRPEASSPSSGLCAYMGRCSKAQDVCRTRRPDLEECGTGRRVRCFFWK